MASTLSERLIIFTRYPSAGYTKTRLIPALGPDGAAGLHRQMTERLLGQARKLLAVRPLELDIFYNGGNERLMRQWLGADLNYHAQGDGGLGQKMANAFGAAFRHGVQSAVLVGTDIPQVSTAILRQALDSLKEKDLVLGPAKDGGYYLIGLNARSFRRAVPTLLSPMAWGTSSVLRRTLGTATELGLTYLLLEELQDVDRPQDLPVWETICRSESHRGPSPRISVIIPTLNEETHIRKAIQRAQEGSETEVIVVDGGSKDHTVDLAQTFHVKVIRTPPSRAGQMNAGAFAATGEILLFLHADTLLPRRYDQAVRRTLSRDRVAAGAFELGISSNRPSLRIMEQVANWRSRWLKLPYGDQAFFLRKDLFTELGGFPHIPIMEDFVLIRKLRKRGHILTIPLAVKTSPRRWLSRGPFFTWILNQAVIFAFYVGYSPEKIAAWYHRDRRCPKGRRR